MNEYAMRDRNPHVPWSPAELAADAAACVAAGASIVHFHGRDPETGTGRADAATLGETVRRIRDSCDAVVMPTIGAGTGASPEARLAPLAEVARDPASRPDLAPVDLGSFNLDPWDDDAGSFRVETLTYVNTVETIRFLAAGISDAGVRPAAVLWSIGSARLLGALIQLGAWSDPVYAELTLSDSLLATHPGTEAGLRALVEFLPGPAPITWTAMNVGGSLLPLVDAAVSAGGHLALGLGDHHYPELGTPTNAEVVAAAVARLGELGRRPATVAEVRADLALPSP
jgi:uncharacterized protein (DUF849 family)